METGRVSSPGGTVEPRPGYLLDGRYRLDSVIARGGMATVFMAIDTRLDRIVAVKVMHRNLADDASFVERFTREARLAAKVAGPEVVAVHDQGTDAETGLAYLVMEYIRGQNLRQLLLAVGPLSPARAVSIMEPVLRALASAHAAGLVHRDVKPENVLLGDDGRVKVADFGLARAAEASTITQTSTSMMGSVAYLAPEQVESGTADARSDVYAAGVLLWELLTGTPPYGGEGYAVMYKHVNEDVPAPSTVTEGIPPGLDALVVRATRRDPADRPADAGAFLSELLAVKATLPVAAPVVGGDTRTLVVPRVAPAAAAPPAAKKPRRRRRGLIATALLVVLGLLALLGGYYLGSYRYTHAPSVYQLTPAAAAQTITKAGLKAVRGPDAFSETVGCGLVMDQKPAAHARVKKHGTVTYIVSKGPDRRVVPDLAGKDVATATAALHQLGLLVAPNPTSQYSSTIPKDHVISTDPPTGARLKPSTAVRLVLSKGPEPVPVPDVAGKTQDDATKTLTDLGFKVSVTQQFSDTVDAGKVISSSPSSGTAPKGSTVTLLVSKGPDIVAVPDVRGDTPDAASAAMRSAGLVPKLFYIPGGGGSVVGATNPKQGKRVKRGTVVTLYVV